MKNLTIKFNGYGHWKIECDYRGKRISTVTTNSQAIDDYNSDESERDGRVLRKIRGYKTLIAEIKRNYEHSK